jgi:hypothetical protein
VVYTFNFFIFFILWSGQVEQPLCLECLKVVSDKLEKEVEDVNRDIQAYESCLESLEAEPQTVLSETNFLKEKEKVVELLLSVLSFYYLCILRAKTHGYNMGCFIFLSI